MKGNKKIFLINICFMTIMVILAIFAVNSVYISSVERMEKSGQQLAENFRLKDDTVFTEYKTTLEMAAYKIKRMINNGKSIDEIYEWMKDYTETVIYSPIACSTGIYAYIDGVFLHGEGYTYDDDFKPEERQWYKNAILSKGNICYSNVYKSAKLNQDVVSLSIKIGEKDVVGIDVVLDDIKDKIKRDTLGKGNIHMTFDTNGHLISHKCWLKEDLIHNDEYFNDVYNAVIRNKNEKNFEYVDIYGNETIIYSSVGNTGWYSVACVSHNNIIDRDSSFFKNIIAFIIIYIVLLIIYMYRTYKSEKKSIKIQEIMNFIGNTYYAIYIVDIKNNVCDVIKANKDITHKMKSSKSYNNLINIISKYVEDDAKEEFCNCFSIDNLRQLAFNRFEDFGGDFRQKFENGEYKWVNVQVFFNVQSFNEDQVMLTFKLIDNEKTKELEQKKLLEESLESARASSKAKNDFLSSMSHDMRTPLNAIIGLSELAEIHINKDANLEVYEYLKKINLSSKHLLGLINDILDMAKIEQGKIELKEDNLDIIDFVTDIVSVFKKQAENKNINLVFDIKNRSLLGDTLRLSQILNNIISNSVKYSGDNANIDIKVIQSNTNYREYGIYQFVIKDDGFGMSEEFLEKLFVPFEREERFYSSNIVGTGLGMPIVKNIVQVMNGKIDVNSKINEGTDFTVTIPMMYVDESSSQSESLDDTNQQIDDITGKKILVVEDNEINMEIATEILEMYGALVTNAWNGQEAVDIFSNSEQNYFDCILMDMQMPVLDGCGATEKIRALDRDDAKSIPIIAVTANAFSDDIAKSMKSGMNAHIAKPIDFNNLMKVLAKYL